MRKSLKTGICFGLTSGVITILGLMVGLHSFVGSKLVIIGGILTVAVADAFSDSLGIHIAEESEGIHNEKEIWESTITTFLSKFVCAITFIVPTLVFDLQTAILVSSVWGLLLLSVLSYYIAAEQNTKKWKVIAEHLLIALVVILIAHYIGDLLSILFS